MKTLIPFLILLFTACQSMPTPAEIQTQINAAVAAADLNRDGQLTNAEIQASGNSPTFWIAVVSGIVGLLGAGTAISAKKDANDLYDATHTTVAKKA